MAMNDAVKGKKISGDYPISEVNVLLYRATDKLKKKKKKKNFHSFL